MQLPVWKTTTDILDYCWTERRAMARAAAVPFTVVLAATWAVHALGLTPETYDWRIGIVFFVQALAYLPVTVTWYRTLVFGPAEARTRPLFILGRLEGKLLLWQVIILLLFIACGGAIGFGIGVVYGVLKAAGLLPEQGSAVLMALAAAAALAFLAAGVIAMCRLSMILAMVSADHPVSVKGAWRMTRGLGWRMAAVFTLLIIAGMLLWALIQILGFLLGVVLGLTGAVSMREIVSYVSLAGETLSGLASLLFGATLFGGVYKQLQSEQPPGGTPEAEAGQP